MKHVKLFEEFCSEGVYTDLLGGTKMFVSSAADSPGYKDVYYSHYDPDTSKKSKLAKKFLDHLKSHGVAYTHSGANKLRMTPENVEKMKKSLFNLKR